MERKQCGFGSYMLAMDEKTYELIGEYYPGNRAKDVINPGLGWMMSFLFVVSFLRLSCLVPLRKVMVMDHKLTYPSGTATAIFKTLKPMDEAFGAVVKSCTKLQCLAVSGLLTDLTFEYIGKYAKNLATIGCFCW